MAHRTKIFGPPGTGKTTRLLNIMEAELAAGVAPDRLAYLTFTVAARQEAKDRAHERFGFTNAQLKWFRTLHSVAYELLGINHQALVATKDDLKEFEDRYGYEFSRDVGKFNDEGVPRFGFNKSDRLMTFDHFRRHRMLDWHRAYKEWHEDYTKFEVERFCEGYERWKAEEGWVDFTDLLERGTTPLSCDVVIVDEAQDLSPLQWKAFWKFAEQAQRIYLAGDDDQAIYEWAGASPEVFLAQDADVVEILPQSHRCPRKVTDLARDIIERVQVRQPKDWQPRDEEGQLTYCSNIEEVGIPDTGSVRILYRNHKYATDIIAYLKSCGEPFLMGGTPSIKDTSGTAILTWEDLRKDRPVYKDELETVFSLASLRRISQAARDCVRQLQRDNITKQSLIDSRCWTEQMFSLPWFDVLDRLKDDEFYLRKVVQRYGKAGLRKEPRIKLSTIHAVKGAEADHVYLLTHMSKLVATSLETNPDAERRVWYVGVTRARKSLTLIGMHNSLF